MEPEQQLVRIFLGGALGRKFGAEWKLYVNSPAEAIKGIDVNTKGELRRYLTAQGTKRFYKIALKHRENLLDKEELTRPSGQGDIYIMPTVKGHNSGIGKVILGIVLVAVAIFGGPAGWAIAGQGAGYFGAGAAAVLGGLGASLILGGVTQLLTPVPGFNQGADNTQSNVFQGNAVAIAQGGAVPLVYGRMLVTPMPISISETSYDQTIVNSFAGGGAHGGYDIEYGPGGIVDYRDRPIDPVTNLPVPGDPLFGDG